MNAINSFHFPYQYKSIEDCNFDEITASVTSDGSRAIVYFIDPIENSSEMKRHDVGKLIETVSQRSKKSGIPAYIISDNTLLAGQANINSWTERIEKDSPVVLISLESMLKYYSLGIDLSYLGSIILTGNTRLISDYWGLLTDMYRSWALSPGLYDLGSYPPVNSEYMNHRARRISRNTRILTGSIRNEYPGLVVHFAGDDPASQIIAENENRGFNGGMFFIKMPDKETVGKFISSLDGDIPDNRFGAIGKRDGFGYQQTTAAAFSDYVRISVGNEDIFVAFCKATHLCNTLKKHLI
jgi:hypothetical protein